MKLASLILSASCMFISQPVFASAETENQPVWPHEKSDLQPDPAVYWQTLENGFRYAILPHNEPPNRVSMRLLVQAGSLQETEEQRGLAHFLEHMAFNGTKHFPAGEMVEYFQRLGMAFGADTNAHTSFHETVYKLELPNKEESVLRDSLQLLRDYGDGMLFPEKEIERERGVILAEMRSRDSVDYRTYQAEMRFILPEATFSERFPIGLEEVVRNVPREEFVSFYQDWYRTDRMALIVVGNITPEELEPLIKEYFADMATPEELAPEVNMGEIGDRGLVARVHHEPEASETSVSIQTIRPYELGVDSMAKRAERIRRTLASRMLSLRLDMLKRKEDSTFTRGAAYAYDWMNFIEIAGIEIAIKPEEWETALKVAEQELRRALEHGFNESEFAVAKANIFREFETAAESAATRHSRDLSAELTRRVSAGDVFTSPEQNLEFLKSVLEDITLEDVQRSFRSIWNGKNTYLFVAGNLDLEVKDDNLLSVYADAREVEVPPLEEGELADFSYTDFGPAGDVAHREEIDSLDVTQIRFANNVRLNLKRTEFEREKVHVYVRFGGGKLDLPKNRPELALLAQQTFKEGGLVEHSLDDLILITAGRNVLVDFGVQDDAFTLSGVTNQRDLEFQMQLLTAYLTAPGFRAEAERLARKGLERLYFQLRHTPEGVMRNQVDRMLAGGDSRFGFPQEEAVMAATMEEVQEWLKPILADSYVEITIVGDFDKENAIADVAATMGALPERAADKNDYTDVRQVGRPDTSKPFNYTYRTDVPKAIAAVYWPTESIWDIRLTRRLSMLSQVLDDRLRKKIREEMGSAYSPYAVSRPSDTWEDFGHLYAIVIADPEQVEEITEAVKILAVEIAEKGVSEDELNRLLTPMMNSLDVWVRNNRYWVGTVLGSSQEYPQRLEWAESITSDYASITAEELTELAGKYLTPEKGLRVHVIPVELKEPLQPPTE